MNTVQHIDIDVPIVVLDDEDTPTAIAPDAAAYLQSVGVTNPATWAAFRIGHVDDAILKQLGLTGRGRPREKGVSLPTFDPRDPTKIVGLIRLIPAQNMHRFATAPIGIAGDFSLVEEQRIVLVDSPLQALRLHQHGVRGVALVEDPAVLSPMLDWLKDKNLVIAGFRHSSRAAIKTALGSLGDKALEITLLPELERSPAASLAALGFGSVEEVSPQLLRDVCAYAVGRIAAGVATQALTDLGIHDAGFVAAFGLGYLPHDVMSILSEPQRKILKGRLYPDSIIVPAYDEQGVIVDLLGVPVSGKHQPILSLHSEPQGLIAPSVTTAFDAVVVVDSLKSAAESYAGGQREVVLFRGLADAKANVARLLTNGVRRAVVRCQQDAEAIASCLQAAGIEVVSTLKEPEVAPEQTITLVQHDQQAEMATFQAGDLTYISEVPWDAGSTVGIRIQRGTQEHADRIELSSEPQRKRCSSSAAMRTGIPAGIILAHLTQLDGAIRDLSAKASTLPTRTAGEMSETQRLEALALARKPDLFNTMVSDLDALGWVGETSAKRFTVLAALSRLLEDPVWVSLTGSSGLNAIAAITPPEESIHVSRLSDSAFYNAEPAALRHKLVIIDDASKVSSGVATALRILKKRGALSASKVTTDPVRGQTKTVFVEVHGPIAVLTSSDDAIDPQLQPHLIEVAGDESPGHVAEMLAARRRRCAQVGTTTNREQVIAKLQNLQRVLSPLPVVIPYAERITGFGSSPSARRDHDLLLSLLEAHALLYQHQRQKMDGAVVANETDFEVVAALITERQSAINTGLGRHAQEILSAIWKAGFTSFTMDDLLALLPNWTRHAFRTGLDELVTCEYISSPRSGRGAARTYHLHSIPKRNNEGSSYAIFLKVGELAEVGETEITNFIPSRATA